MANDDTTLDVHDASADAGGAEGRGGGGAAQTRFDVGDVVHYFHHHDARKPMPALVVGIHRGADGEPESYTLTVFTSKGGSFPAFDMKPTPTGKTGHYFAEKPCQCRSR